MLRHERGRAAALRNHIEDALAQTTTTTHHTATTLARAHARARNNNVTIMRLGTARHTVVVRTHGTPPLCANTPHTPNV